MIQDEINEGNLLIAEFMGGRYISVDQCIATGEVNSKDTIYTSISDLKYLTSWDWLMPVVEKIETMHNGGSYLYSFEMGKDWCGITTNDFNPETIIAKSVAGNKMHSFWLAIVDFIKWHNKTNFVKN